MPEDDLAVLHRRGCRQPAPRQACFQQEIGCGTLIPDGDRRHHPESGRVINKPKPVATSDQDIVAEFVLRHHPSGE